LKVPLFDDDELVIINKKLNLGDGIEFNYDINLPDHVGGNTFQSDNIVVTLGRVLFYDKTLSIDYSISCSTCHLQEAAFAENIPVSVGLNEELGSRNSIGLGSFISMRQQYYGGPVVSAVSIQTENKFFWDERAATINEQMSEAFESPIEMGMDIPDLVERVKSEPYYQLLFEKAFSDGEVTSNRIFSAMQSFMSTIHSTASRFDEVYDETRNTDINQPFIGFSASENLGKKLFMQNCKSCHGNSLTPFIEAISRIANTGLEMDYADNGVGEVSHDSDDNGKFKIPPLKNVAVTYPYMHDGRFETLEEVIEFYSSGIQAHPNLSAALKNQDGTPKKFNFTDEEKTALVDFLKTLTDTDLLTHPKFSDPFK